MAKDVNTQNIDFDKEPQTVEEAQNQMIQFMKKYNRNEISLSGKVVSTHVGEAKQKFDKKTNEAVLDENGMPAYWEPFRSVEIIFEGGSLNINLDKEHFENIVLGGRYLFEGIMGLNYGKVQPIFHSSTLIA